MFTYREFHKLCNTGFTYTKGIKKFPEFFGIDCLVYHEFVTSWTELLVTAMCKLCPCVEAG